MKKFFAFVLICVFIMFSGCVENPNDNNNTSNTGGGYYITHQGGGSQSGGSSSSLTRAARNNDLGNVNMVFPSGREVTVSFVPYYDITALKIQVIVKDDIETMLDSKVITVGDVIDGQQYVIEYLLPDNDITYGKRIETCEIKVYSGTIYYQV